MKVLVVGETGHDSTLYCKCSRLCPEACVPVAEPIRQTLNGGMALNVFANLQSLMPDSQIFFLGQKTPIVKTRIVDEMSGQLIVRIDANDTVKEEERLTEEMFFGSLKTTGLKLVEFNAVVISSYKNFISEAMINMVAGLCKFNNVPLFLDCKYYLGEWSKDVFCVKINNKEYQENLKYGKSIPESYCSHLIVTKGNEGAEWINKGLLYPLVNKREVKSVVGLGDSFISLLVAKYLTTKDLELAIKFANWGCSVAASKSGVYVVKPEDVADFVS